MAMHGAVAAKSFGERVRLHRIAAKLTQHELARRVRVSQPRISQIEQGKVKGRLPLRTVKDLAEGLGLDPAVLVGDDPTYDVADFELIGIPVAPTELPIATTVLVGRESELNDLGAMFAEPSVRLVTLTGTGGVGKSLLGLHCIQRFGDGSANRGSVVSLAMCSDIAHVISAISHVTGVRQRDERPLRERLVAALSAQPRMVMLDNAEHVLEPVADFVSELLRSSTDLRLIVTSRSPLRIRGECEFPVGPLRLPDPTESSDYAAVAASPAVQLFVRRARVAFPRFAVTESNAEVLATICRRLDGLPLAIELAAARTKVLTLTQIAKRSEAPLQFLQGGPRDLPNRQQSLRTAISWSLELLSPAEQTVFRRLSVFSGGFSYDAAEWISAEPVTPGSRTAVDGSAVNTAEALECLVDQSLVTKRTSRDLSHRFGMLETIRSLATELLMAAGEAEHVAERHFAWCLALAEAAEAHWFGPEQRAWLRRLDVERDNLTAALTWARQNGDLEAGVRLAIALTDYWYLRGHLSEGRRWLEWLLGALPWNPNNSVSCHIRVRLLASISQLAQPNGDLDTAARRADESLRLARALDDVTGIARAATLLGNIAIARGDAVTADGYHRNALELFRGIDDVPWAIVGLNNLALVSQMQRDVGKTLTLATEALHLAREISDEWGQGIALRMLGDVALARRGVKVAARCYLESLSLGRDNGSLWTIADCLAAIGSLAISQGKAERGVRFLGAAHVIYDRIGIHMPPKLRLDWASAQCTARTLLGDERFGSAWQSGLDLGLDLAMAEAFAFGRALRDGTAG